jgi:hypothetical protein
MRVCMNGSVERRRGLGCQAWPSGWRGGTVVICVECVIRVARMIVARESCPFSGAPSGDGFRAWWPAWYAA